MNNADPEKRGLVAFGKTPGTGKTMSAIKAAMGVVDWRGSKLEQEWMADGEQEAPAGIYLTSHRIRTQYDEVHRDAKGKAEWQKALIKTGLLLLDDIDKVKGTDGFVELLFGVLDERRSEDRTTIITTNLVGDGLVKEWGDKYGPYLVQRIRDHCLAVDFDS